MKIYSATKWNDISSKPVSDTGWRNITSSLSSSVLGGATIVCKYRRVDDEISLVFDVTVAGTSMTNTRIFVATSSTNVLRKIGLPVGTVQSFDRATLTSSAGSDYTISPAWITITGKGGGVATAREAEMYWKATSSTSTAAPLTLSRYTMFWVTPDAFPTTIPGTATTL